LQRSRCLWLSHRVYDGVEMLLDGHVAIVPVVRRRANTWPGSVRGVATKWSAHAS
jgi:hypothetical protein